MFDLTLSTLVTRILAALVIIGLHGFFLALAARLLGDGQAARAGRLTVSPFAHFEPAGFLALILFGLGWVRPLPLNIGRMRGHRLAVPALLAASLVPVALLAVVAVNLLPRAAVSFSYSTAPLVAHFLVVLVRLSTSFILSSFLPLAPFCLGQLLVSSREQWREFAARARLPLAVAALLLSFLLSYWIGDAVDVVVRHVFGNIALLSNSR